MTLLLLSVVIIAVNAQWPKWPSDFSWTMGGGTSKRKNCLQITEAASPRAHTWIDNHFCWKGKSDLGFKWSENGAIAGMKCTNVHEHAAPKYWHNNYLCVPKNSPYNFKWSQNGRISGLSCVQWAEGSDPNTWNDNFLCGKPVAPTPTPAPTPAPTEEASYGNIIVWLRQLIAEGKAEIVRIDQKTAALKGKLTAAKKALSEAERKEGEAEAAADAAATALGKAQGAWKVCLAKFNSEMKRLNEEIAIFTKVKDILSGLINGKQLLEKEKADVKALISEEDQADPVKVRAIIALVQKLIDAAQAEIKRITADRNRCASVLKKAEEANAAAIGVWKAAQVAVEKAEDNVEAAQGALDAQTQYANKRIAIVNGEIGQFEEIIELLNPLFE